MSGADEKKNEIEAEYKYAQGLHSGTVRRKLREQYGIEHISLDRRLRMDDGRWWNIYFVPIDEDRLDIKHIKNVVEVVNGGVMFAVRNYHLKDKTMAEVEEILGHEDKRKEKAVEYYEQTKERAKARAHAYWEKHKLDPVWREKQRTRNREWQRAQKGTTDASLETTRRNMNRRIYANAIVYEDEEEIAQLLERDEAVGLTPEEQKRLEELLNGSDGSTVPELREDGNGGDEPIPE